MLNPYTVGNELAQTLFDVSLGFQSDLIKISASVIQSNPLTTWMKLVSEDISTEFISSLTSLNRNMFN